MRITFEHKGKDYVIDYDGTTFTPRRAYQSENSQGEMVDREKDLGYFSYLGNAVKKIVGSALGESDETVTLADFVERYESAVKELKDLLESEF